MTRKTLWLLMIGLSLGCRPAMADHCVVTITGLYFGTYTGTPLSGTAAGKVECSNNWQIPLDSGTGAGATETVRKMTGPNGNELSYQIFQDPAHVINWGNTPSTELTGPHSEKFTVYGQIPAGQYLVPGTYTDTLSSDTTSFTVTATIQASCTLSASPLVFGIYAGSAVDSTTMLSIVCTNNTPYSIGLNAGTAPGATVTSRSMVGPAGLRLNYSLFRDSSNSMNWGNTVGMDTDLGTGNGTKQSIPVYGEIPKGQLAPPGNYSDTITVTLTY